MLIFDDGSPHCTRRRLRRAIKASPTLRRHEHFGRGGKRGEEARCRCRAQIQRGGGDDVMTIIIIKKTAAVDIWRFDVTIRPRAIVA